MADRDQAIKDAIESRETHVRWARWFEGTERCPDCETCAEDVRRVIDAGIGDRQHHLDCIAKYDNILACLGVTVRDLEIQNLAAEELRVAVA